MIIAVNTRFLIKEKLEGIGWFTYETMKLIAQKHRDHTFVFIFDRPYPKEFVFSSNVIPVIAKPQARHPFLWYYWFQFAVPKILRDTQADVFVSPDGFLPLGCKIPTLSIIHDLNFIHRPQEIPFLIREYYLRFFPKFSQEATRIATVSEFSKQDISHTLKINESKIDVVYNGSSDTYQPLLPAEIEKTKNEITQGNDYFLFVGALLPRKNVTRLLKAFEDLKKNAEKLKVSPSLKLVIVGAKMFKTAEMEHFYEKMKFKKDVVFTGHIPQEKLRYILGSALALTFVPYFEGFGMPIIEAMYCNVPVITSNITSMPEISGNAAIHVNPFSVDSIRDAMVEVATKEDVRQDLIEKGQHRREKFTWKHTADALWKSIEQLFVE